MRCVQVQTKARCRGRKHEIKREGERRKGRREGEKQRRRETDLAGACDTLPRDCHILALALDGAGRDGELHVACGRKPHIAHLDRLERACMGEAQRVRCVEKRERRAGEARHGTYRIRRGGRWTERRGLQRQQQRGAQRTPALCTGGETRTHRDKSRAARESNGNMFAQGPRHRGAAGGRTRRA